jgi:hypothetical protein
MIPAHWEEERRALIQRQHAQRQPGYKFQKKKRVIVETIITDAMIDALNDVPVTPDEHKLIASDARGAYRKGDTRGFVLAEEQACINYNCWMVRTPDGSVEHIGEPPDVHSSRTP